MANDDLVPSFDDETDNSLKIFLDKVENSNKAIAITLNGYIDTYNSVFFQKQIRKIVSVGFRNLVFNCKALNYVSSTGIGSFTSFLKLVKPAGGDIVLVGIQPKVYEVFQLLGFSQFFNIEDSVEDATKHFSNKEGLESSSVFPKTFACPICSKQLRVDKSGRFRCSGCKSVLVVDQNGNVTLG